MKGKKRRGEGPSIIITVVHAIIPRCTAKLLSTVSVIRGSVGSGGYNKIVTRIVRACKNIFFIAFQEVRLLRGLRCFSAAHAEGRGSARHLSSFNRRVKRATNRRPDK